MNGYIIDIGILVILLIACMIGYRKGLLRGLLSFCGFIGSAIIAYYTKDYVASLLEKFFNLGTVISDFILKQIGKINEFLVNQKFSSSQEMIEAINNSNLGAVFKKLFEKIINGVEVVGEMSVGEVFAGIISNLVLMVISFVLVYIVIRILVFILNKVFSRTNKIPILGKVNSWLGVVLGLVNGLIFVASVLCIGYLFSLIPDFTDLIIGYVDSSFITKYAFNLIEHFLALQ